MVSINFAMGGKITTTVTPMRNRITISSDLPDQKSAVRVIISII
jgi:hypothetical protein